MKLERLLEADIWTYLTMGAILLCVISTIYLAKAIYSRHKIKTYRYKLILSLTTLLLSVALLFYYYRPVALAFQKPAIYDAFVYQSKPNSTGGINMIKDKLSANEYSQLLDLLGKATFSRQIVDWKGNGHHEVQYDLTVIPLIHKHSGIYLRELHLYADNDSRYSSYLIATHGGRQQTYRISNESLIAELITALEDRAIFTE
jgi:hypothetical protein